MNITTVQGDVWSCQDWQNTKTGTLTFNATVVESALNKLTLDACSPAADCVPFLHHVSFDAVGLNVSIPVGSFVRVEASVEVPWGCAERLLITNLPEWDGYPNPNLANHQLWLAAADGMFEMFDDAPFVVDPVKLDCPGYPSGCGGTVEPGQYALRFTATNDPAGDVIVETGDTKVISLLDTPVAAVRNLRSFESGFCDDYWNWGYWAAPSGIK